LLSEFTIAFQIALVQIIRSSLTVIIGAKTIQWIHHIENGGEFLCVELQRGYALPVRSTAHGGMGQNFVLVVDEQKFENEKSRFGLCVCVQKPPGHTY
jgi:hypothetical protein